MNQGDSNSNINQEVVKRLAEIKTLCQLKGRDGCVSITVRTIPFNLGRIATAKPQDIDCMFISDDNPYQMIAQVIDTLKSSPAAAMTVSTSCHNGKIEIRLGQEVPYNADQSIN